MGMICDKCKSQMIKKQTINASNSKYERYLCPKCGNTKQICVGVNI